MATAEELQEYVARLGTIVEEWRVVDVNSAAEAKAALDRWRVAQKEIAWIKRQINLHIKGLRTDGLAAVEKIEKEFRPRLFESRSAATRRRARAKRAVEAELRQQIRPHEEFKGRIDELMLAMEKVKLQLGELIAQK